MDRHKLGKECCRELLRNGVFRTLGEGTAADWDGICRRLAQRVEPQAQQPAWPQQDPQDFCTDRLKRASCSSEVAVFMLRLVVRAACLGSSWYGPWDSMEAVQQLIKADAWSSLLDALVAMLDTFRSDLDKQYNAINIVSDILHVSRALFFPVCDLTHSNVAFGPLCNPSRCHAGVYVSAQIFYSLSEWHTHVDFRPSHVEHTGLPEAAVEVLYLVMKYAATLPCLQRDQASCADTALLMVDLSYQSPS